MQALLALSRAIDRLNAFVGKYSIWLIFAATFISATFTYVQEGRASAVMKLLSVCGAAPKVFSLQSSCGG